MTSLFEFPKGEIFHQDEIPTSLLQRLLAASSILVQGHVRPDGDTLGSSLGLTLALRKLDKRVHICLTDGVPERFAYLPGVEHIGQDPEINGPYDLGIVCDAASYARTGFPLMESGLVPFLINIDHHPTNEGYGHLAWIHAESSSTCEMAYRLILALGVEIDQAIAAPLMNGISTDTGFFKYPCTTPRTMRIFADLMETGVDHAWMHRQLFEENPLGVQQLRGRALERIHPELDGKLLWTWVDVADGKECQVEGALASIGVNPLCPIQGAELVACFEGRPDNTTIVEFRSRGDLPVDGIARELGGGGHAKASGCTVPLNLMAARTHVLPKLRKLIKKEAPGVQAAQR
jgi:phosphoesterase RecJ-like protein